MIKATYIEHMGSDVSVVNSARVSFGKKSDSIGSYDIHMGNWAGEIPVLEDRDEKLIKYLAKHKHLSPFGHCFASFHVKAPVFVARQLVKHKFLRWNEISRRYVDDDPEFYAPSEWRGKSEDKKQGSDGTVEVRGSVPVGRAMYACRDAYEGLLKVGVCPEQARMVLPQSMMTEWYWSGSLDAFADMCRLRCAPDTQAETRMVASEISELMGQLYPSSWDALIGDGK
jgi:thymidylate synthase (FAD)